MEKQEVTNKLDTDNNEKSHNNDIPPTSSISGEDLDQLKLARGIKKKKLLGLAKTEAELVPNTTGKKQGFVAYSVTYGKPDSSFENFLLIFLTLEMFSWRVDIPLDTIIKNYKIKKKSLFTNNILICLDLGPGWYYLYSSIKLIL